jgi:hypothetical protein
LHICVNIVRFNFYIDKGIDDNFSEIVSLDDYHHMRSELLGNIEGFQVFSFELNEDHIGAIAFSTSSDYAGKLLTHQIPVEFQELINT